MADSCPHCGTIMEGITSIVTGVEDEYKSYGGISYEYIGRKVMHKSLLQCPHCKKIVVK